MSIFGDKRLVPKKSPDNIYMDTTTDHITPCSRMRARGNNTGPEESIYKSLQKFTLLLLPVDYVVNSSRCTKIDKVCKLSVDLLKNEWWLWKVYKNANSCK